MTIHREGYGLIALAAGVACILAAIGHFALGQWPILDYLFCAAALFVFVAVLQFFRIPKRQHTAGENLVICPADGKVVTIEEMNEAEFLNGERRIQISIFMSPLNVHVNRYPISGRISYFKYHPGLFLVAWHPKSSTDNERTTVVIDNGRGSSILLRQIAGAVARRIIWYCKEGQTVTQNDELGFIKFGSRVDVMLPLSAKVKVQLGQAVQGGVTVLAEI